LFFEAEKNADHFGDLRFTRHGSKKGQRELKVRAHNPVNIPFGVASGASFPVRNLNST
jgi:hypothetical protein